LVYAIFQNALATTYTTTSSGSWNNSGTWDANGVPPNSLSSGSTINVNHVITSGNATIASSGTVTLNVNSSTTLTSVTFDGSGTVNIVVTNGVTFSVGIIYNNNNTTTNITGNITSTGDVNIYSGSFSVSGNLDAGGNLTIYNNSTVNLNSANITSDLVLNNGIINITGIVNVGGNADLNNTGSFVNISDSGALAVTGLLDTDNVDIVGSGVVSWGSITMANNANFPGLGDRVIPPYNPYDLDGGPGTLPITLISFNGKIVSGKIDLYWSTASEINFDYFSIQRSKDGVNYEEIGTVKGHGFSKIKRDYQFIDERPVFGTSYYRLQSIDYDGYTETFRPVSVVYEGDHTIQYYPNPIINNELHVIFDNPAKTTLTYHVYNFTGKLLFQDKIETNRFNIDFANYGRGIYYVKISDGRQIKVLKN